MFERTTLPSRGAHPELADVVDALRPILEVGFPIEDSEIHALEQLGNLLNWPPQPDERRQYANDVLRHLLQSFPIQDIANAARTLFGDTKPSIGRLDKRQEAAAKTLHLSEDKFRHEIEPSILRAFAYQILRSYWPDNSEKPDRAPSPIFPTVIYASAIVLLILSGLTGWPPSSLDSTGKIAVRITAGFLGIVAVIVSLIIHWQRSSERRDIPHQAIPPIPDPEFLLRCQSEAAERLGHSTNALPPMIDMILSPSQFRMRTVELISLDGRNMRQAVSIDFSFVDIRKLLPNTSPPLQGSLIGDGNSDPPPNAPSTTAIPEDQKMAADRKVEKPQFLYIPLLIPAKGQLMDRFEIKGSDGQPATSLSYQQSLRILSLGLRYLILSALTELSSTALTELGPTPNLNKPEFLTAELSLLGLISRRGPINRHSSEWKHLESEVKVHLDSIADLYPATQPRSAEEESMARETAMQKVKNYVLMLVHSYPIIVAVPNTDPQMRQRLYYQRVMVPRPQDSPRFRLWLGLRPNFTTIQIKLAFDTDSYHLEVVGPPDYYVNRQFVGCTGCGRGLRSEWRGGQFRFDPCDHAPIGRDDKCYLRIRQRLGQNYFHLYMRGFGASSLDPQKMIAQVGFSEAPPGVDERALFSAIIETVVFGAFGYIASHFQNASLPTDVPALFLALPGVAAAWFGFNSDVDTILRSSLTARLSLLLTEALSIAGVVCYLLQHFLGWTAGPTWSFMGIHQSLWLILLGLSIANVAIIGYQTALRIMHFVWLSSRGGWDEPKPGLTVPSLGKE